MFNSKYVALVFLLFWFMGKADAAQEIILLSKGDTIWGVCKSAMKNAPESAIAVCAITKAEEVTKKTGEEALEAARRLPVGTPIVMEIDQIVSSVRSMENRPLVQGPRDIQEAVPVKKAETPVEKKSVEVGAVKVVTAKGIFTTLVYSTEASAQYIANVGRNAWEYHLENSRIVVSVLSGFLVFIISATVLTYNFKFRRRKVVAENTDKNSERYREELETIAITKAHHEGKVVLKEDYEALQNKCRKLQERIVALEMRNLELIRPQMRKLEA